MTLKDIGRDLKHTFTAHNAENAAMTALPAFTTAAGAALGGPLGAAGGATAAYFADKGIQNAIHGDGIRKGTIAHVRYHKKKRFEGGNDNVTMIKELKALLIKLSHKKMLPKGQVRAVLEDLILLGY